jgi:hypothetical protein
MSAQSSRVIRDLPTPAPPAWGMPHVDAHDARAQLLARLTARRDETRVAYEALAQERALLERRMEPVPDALDARCLRCRDEWRAAEADLATFLRRAAEVGSRSAGTHA